MQKDICLTYVQDYLGWLNKNFVVACNEQRYCHIITPFLRPDNDHIELFIESKDDYISITDDGATQDYLYLSGIDIDTPTRKGLLDSIQRKYNVHFDGYEITMKVGSTDNIGIGFNNFINAISSISNLIYTGQERGKATFRDDVRAFLTLNQIGFTSVELMGSTKKHKFDFAIYKKNLTLIDPLSAQSASYGTKLAQLSAFQWGDLRKNGVHFAGVSLIDDREDIWIPEAIRILNGYSDYTYAWSNKDKLFDIVA